jgi:hypothetical protein
MPGLRHENVQNRRRQVSGALGFAVPSLVPYNGGTHKMWDFVAVRDRH